MNLNSLFSFFRVSSKVIIFVPLVIVALAVLLSPRDSARVKSQQAAPTITPSVTPSLKNPLAFLSQISSGEASFDLKGPLHCTGSLEGGEYTVYVKDEQVKATLVNGQEKSEVRFYDDCLYRWTNASDGTKTCGIGQYLSLLRSFPFFGQMMGNSLLNRFLPSGSGSADLKDGDVQAILNSCKKEEFTNTVFTVPVGIRFTEVSLTP